MQFQVPQFISIEDKIFGPLTIRQFIYVAGGVGFCFLIYRFVSPFFLAVILMLPIGIFALALAFFKMNGKPFIFTVESAFRYILGGKLYVWRKTENKVISKKVAEPAQSIMYVPKISDSKLRDLTWSLNTKDVGRNQK